MAELDTKLEPLGAASALEMSQLQNKIVAQVEEAKASAWHLRMANTAYVLGDGVIVPGAHNFNKFLSCTVAGTTGTDALQTDWDELDVGDTVTDGGVTWTCSARDDAPVSSVNGLSGAVVLDAEDVGAEAEGAVIAHNASEAAHTALFTSKANVSHTHTQSDVTGLPGALSAKAPIASPAFTGTPTAPTAAAGTSTTQIATTEFVAGTASGKLDVPIGCVFQYAGSGSVPAGYLICDGAAISRIAYAHLYVAIGGTYGSGDGSTTFNIPDFRGKFLRGLGGGSASIGTKQDEGLPDHYHSTIYSLGGTFDRTFGNTSADGYNLAGPDYAAYGAGARLHYASVNNPVYGAYNGKWIISWNAVLPVGATVIIDGVTYTVAAGENTLPLQYAAVATLFQNSDKWTVSYQWETGSAVAYKNGVHFTAQNEAQRYPEIGGSAVANMQRFADETGEPTKITPENYAVQFIIKY